MIQTFVGVIFPLSICVSANSVICQIQLERTLIPETPGKEFSTSSAMSLMVR